MLNIFLKKKKSYQRNRDKIIFLFLYDNTSDSVSKKLHISTNMLMLPSLRYRTPPLLIIKKKTRDKCVNIKEIVGNIVVRVRSIYFENCNYDLL